MLELSSLPFLLLHFLVLFSVLKWCREWREARRKKIEKRVEKKIEDKDLLQKRVEEYSRVLAATTCFNICFNLKTHKLEKGFNTDDAVALSEALKKNNTVEQLCLMSSDIGNVGGVAIASALRQNTTLKYLDLRDSNIGWSGAQAIVEALNFNRTLLYLRGIDLRKFARKAFDIPTELISQKTSDDIMKASFQRRKKEFVRLRYEFLVLRRLKNSQRILDRPCMKENTVGVAILATLSITDVPFKNIIMFLSC